MFRYLRFDERLQLGSVSGTPDADYLADWLIDGRPGYPVRTTGAFDFTATGATTVNADTFAIVTHNVAAGVNATVSRNGGTAVGVIVPGTWDADGIPFNAYLRLVAAVSVSSARLQVSSGPVTIGDFWVGLSRTLASAVSPTQTADYNAGRQLDPGEPIDWQESILAPYDDGIAAQRKLTGEIWLLDAAFADLEAWYSSTRRNTRPSLVIPDDTVNDAWLANMRYRAEHVEDHHHVTVDIVEIPRVRW